MMKSKLVLSALLTLLLATPAFAQDATTSAPTQGQIARMRTEVSNEIYSPFCPGKTLAMCTSPNAAAVRRDIQDLAREGKDKETIKNEIVARYGEEFRLTEPPAQDNAALAAIIIAGFLAAAALIFFLSRRVINPSASTNSTKEKDEPLPPEQDDLSEDEQDYLDEIRAHVQS